MSDLTNAILDRLEKEGIIDPFPLDVKIEDLGDALRDHFLERLQKSKRKGGEKDDR